MFTYKIYKWRHFQPDIILINLQAIDLQGNSLHLALSPKRDTYTTHRLLIKVLNGTHTNVHRMITVDQSPAYPMAIDALKAVPVLLLTAKFRQGKRLKNLNKPDYRFVNRWGIQSLRCSSLKINSKILSRKTPVTDLLHPTDLRSSRLRDLPLAGINLPSDLFRTAL